MKKTIVLLSSIAILAACGNDDSKKTSSNEQKPDVSLNPDYDKGLDLVVKNDCLTCHKVEEVLAGPAYKDIAKKYAGQTGIEDSLAQTIIKGVPAGTGKWGTLPMTPHPGLSEADAKAMVKYILLLK